MLTYYKFNHDNQLTNIVAGHHQWDEGIKSVEEINSLYDCQKLDVKAGDCILLVSLNRTYNQTCAKGIYQRFNIYEATRKYWAIASRQAAKVNYVLGVYKGIVRCVIKVKSYEFVNKSDDRIVFKKPRCCFEGEQCSDSVYLNKDVSDYPFGSGGSVRYIFCQNCLFPHRAYAAFTSKTSEVFKEQHDIAPTVINERIQYMCHGTI